MASPVPVGKGEVEDTALAGPRLDPDAAAVTFDHLPADGQADARARVFRAGVQALEDEEDPLGVLRRDADAVVADGEHPFPPPAGRPDVHVRRPVRAELDGV